VLLQLLLSQKQVPRYADHLAIFRPNFVQNCEFRFFVQNVKFRDLVRFSSKTNFLCPYLYFEVLPVNTTTPTGMDCRVFGDNSAAEFHKLRCGIGKICCGKTGTVVISVPFSPMNKPITLVIGCLCFRTKSLVLELLAAICLVTGGHDVIIKAFDHFKEVSIRCTLCYHE